MQNSDANQGRTVQIRIPTSRPYITYGLLASIVGVFLLQLVYEQINERPNPLTPWGALDTIRIVRNGEYYRLFTSMFLHVNQIHLFFNGLALYSFGRSVEAFFGHIRFFLIYFLGGLCGSVASFILTRGTSVGASGAIFAIFGAEMIFLYANRQLLGASALSQLRSLVVLAVINFGFGIYTQLTPGALRLDNWAHVGGFFAGVVLTWFMGPQYKLRADAAVEGGIRIVDGNASINKVWRTTALFAIGLVVATVYAVANWRTS
jgi:rhomboid protease GluP